MFEDYVITNGLLDERDFLCYPDRRTGELNCPPEDAPFVTTLDEDLDGDRRLTAPGGCEGSQREDQDCDGHLDRTREDLNGDGILDAGEDLDADGRLDAGTEDRNGNELNDDLPFPADLYPYGRLTPLRMDRDYVIDRATGYVSGPYYEYYEDQRTRFSLRQDLSLFVNGDHASHDVKMGYLVEREGFERTTTANAITAIFLPAFDTGTRADEVANPGTTYSCNPYADPCEDPGDGRLSAFLPMDPVVEQEASGRSAGMYLQDQFRPLPNLSISLGLRFDREALASSGYTDFDPGADRNTFDRLVAFTGVERGLPDHTNGNGDGVISHGFLADPISHGVDIVASLCTDLIDPIQNTALSKMMRHRNGLPFVSAQLKALFPELFEDGVVDPAELAAKGVPVQAPEAFTITNNNLAPRLSVAWDPGSDGRTKLFAT